MDDFTLARVIHVMAIVAWIGGVAFVTLVSMPMLVAKEAPEQRLARFAEIEGGFAWQARIWVLLAGIGGCSPSAPMAQICGCDLRRDWVSSQ